MCGMFCSELEFCYNEEALDEGKYLKFCVSYEISKGIWKKHKDIGIKATRKLLEQLC
jgi:hypothetical protein